MTGAPWLNLAIALALAFGFAAVGDLLLRRPSRGLLAWNQSFIVGAGFAATLLFPLTLIFGPYTLKAVLAGLAIAAMWRLRHLRPQPQAPRPEPLLSWLLAAGFIVLGLHFTGDGLDIWAGKALALLQHGSLTSKLSPMAREVVYPNLVPLYEALLAQIRGFEWNELKAISPVFYWSLLISVYHAARKLLTRPQALLVVLLAGLLALSPLFGADMPLGAAVAAVIAAALDSESPAAFPWLVATLIATKSEGLILAGIAIACAARRSWHRSAIVIAGAVFLRWAYVDWAGVYDPHFTLGVSPASNILVWPAFFAAAAVMAVAVAVGCRTLAGRRQVFATAAAIALLSAINLYVFRDHWLGRASFPFDFPLAYYALVGYWTTSLQMGEWPHWIPYQSMGYPAALNPQLGLFYLPFWTFVIFRQPYTLHAANIVQALHVLFGSVGYFVFARRWFRLPVALAGALAFGLFGGFFSNAEHPDIVRGFAWIPWLLWALLPDDPVDDQPAARLRPRNLLLAPIVACFVTGVYPGLMLSGLWMCGIGIVAWAAASPSRQALRAAAVQGVQVGLGIGMALAYLLPTLTLSSGLKRTYNYARYSPWYLQAADYFQLFLPSNLVTRGDYSMHAMQIPLFLLLCLPFARARKTLAAPIVAIGLLAFAMCFEGLRFFSGAITGLLPVMRMSRFPAGDYRGFVFVALLTGSLAGMEHLLESPDRRRNAVMLCAALAVLLAPCLLLRATPPLATWIAVEAVACLLIIAGYLFARSERAGAVWVYCVAAAGVVLSVATFQQMKTFWDDPNVEAFVYDHQGLPLETPDHQLRVNGVFARQSTRRPARMDAPPEIPGTFPVTWRGYIDGTYMTRDHGAGSLAIGLNAIAGDPVLAELMRRPGTLLALPCTPLLCGSGDATGVALESAAETGRELEYSRNFAVYDVDLPAASLVVENEMYAPGWRGICETHGEHLVPERIDGALRGWVLGPGPHRLRVEYRTPRLLAGALLAALSAACWAGLAVWLGSRSPAGGTTGVIRYMGQ
jgi:hypothetical protein